MHGVHISNQEADVSKDSNGTGDQRDRGFLVNVYVDMSVQKAMILREFRTKYGTHVD